MIRVWFGARVDLRSACRDMVLAGIFTAVVAWAATARADMLAYGLLNGMMLGFVLHIVPPEPAVADRRSGRIVLRGASGACAGALLAPALNWLTSGAVLSAAHAPTLGAMSRASFLGCIAGLVWYVMWGVWETRTR